MITVKIGARTTLTRAGLVATTLLAGLVAACSSGSDGTSKAQFTIPERTGTAAAEVFDLAHWALTLPIDANGGTSGTAVTLRPQQLGDYESQWFYVTPDGGVSFFAPINGATTPNSRFARSELRQMLDPNDTSVNWTWDDRAEMTAFVAVNQTPLSNGKVTVGQILGYNRDDTDISVLAKLVFEYNSSGKATLYALISPSPYASGSTAQRLVIHEAMRLNEGFPYFIRVENRRVYLGTGSRGIAADIDPNWQDVGLYFRAGAALHTAGDSDVDGARVTFHDLQASVN